mgnify:CR=1 FL=1
MDEKIVKTTVEAPAAAKKAAAHEMIIKLPDGYDTRVTANGGRLSGGQIQRIGGQDVRIIADGPGVLRGDGVVERRLAVAVLDAEPFDESHPLIGELGHPCDLLVGEVWICGGQSNMAFQLLGATNAKEAIAACFPDAG